MTKIFLLVRWKIGFAPPDSNRNPKARLNDFRAGEPDFPRFLPLGQGQKIEENINLDFLSCTY